jgi:primary-amine oxidase
LNESEINSVVDWMLAYSGLSLDSYDDSGFNGSYITMIYLAPPLKAAAMAYLDGTPGAVRPDRNALVGVTLGKRFPPVVREYVVGPLPISSTYTIQLILFCACLNLYVV